MLESLIAKRHYAIGQRLDQMKDQEEWKLLQQFSIGLLSHDGSKDVQLGSDRHDFAENADAIVSDGKICFVAVSFEGCSFTDAKQFYKLIGLDLVTEGSGNES